MSHSDLALAESVSTSNESLFLIVYILILIYCCFGLAVVCDVYFVPALQKLSYTYDLPPDIAGSTLMALGASVPELFASLIGVFVTQDDIGTGSIIGSSCFNLIAVPAACAFVAAAVFPHNLELQALPVTRNSAFYTVTILVLLLIIKDNKVDIPESLILLLFFVMYMAFMVFSARKGTRTKPSELSRDRAQAQPEGPTAGQDRFRYQEHDDLMASSRSSSSVSTADSAIAECLRTTKPAELHNQQHQQQQQQVSCNNPTAAGRASNYCLSVQQAFAMDRASQLGGHRKPPQSCAFSLATNYQYNQPEAVHYQYHASDETKTAQQPSELSPLVGSKATAMNGGSKGLPRSQSFQQSWCSVQPIAAEAATGARAFDLSGLSFMKNSCVIRSDRFAASINGHHSISGCPQNSRSLYLPILGSSNNDYHNRHNVKYPLDHQHLLLDMNMADKQQHQDEGEGWLSSRWFNIPMFPLTISMKFLMPGKLTSSFCTIWTFLISVTLIGGLTYISVWMVHLIGDSLGIPETVAGMTILSWGTGIPELIASIVLIKKTGEADMAICNTIGSNVIDVSFCLSVPWFIKCLMNKAAGGEPIVAIQSAALPWTSSLLILSVVLLLIILKLHNWQLCFGVGCWLTLVYVLFVASAMYLESAHAERGIDLMALF